MVKIVQKIINLVNALAVVLSYIRFEIIMKGVFMREVNTLFIGGTAFSLGGALSSSNSLILCESALLGEDFSSAYYTGECDEEGYLANLLIKKAQLKDGKVHLPALTAILYDIARDNKLNIDFSSTLISVKKEAEYYVCEVVSSKGIYFVRSRQIVDTRGQALDKTDYTFSSKYICAMCIGVSNKNDFEYRDFIIRRGLYENFAYVGLEVHHEDDIIEARKKFIRKWRECGVFSNWKIAAISDYFTYLFDKEFFEEEINQNYFVCPSSSYTSPTHAFEAGRIFGGRK